MRGTRTGHCLRLATSLLLLLGNPVHADDYTDGIQAASQARNTEWDESVFTALTVIDASDLHTIEVDDGAGGTMTIEAVKVVTLTNFVTPYNNATYLQPFVVDTTGNFRSNIWVTVAGDMVDYYLGHNLPVTNNETVNNHMLEALGLGHWGLYKALTFYVEPEYITRPSFAPSISENTTPDWDGSTYAFTNVSTSVDPTFIGFAPTVLDVSGTNYERPFTEFGGPENYADWLEAWSTASYNTAANRAFPYTGLGWTWNWNPDPGLNGFALSEFLVSGGATYYFDSLLNPINLVPEPSVFALLVVTGGAFLLRRRKNCSGAL